MNTQPFVSEDSTTASCKTLSVKPTVDFKKTQAPSSCSEPRKRLIIRIKVPKIADNNTDLSETQATVPALTGNKNRDYIRENIAKWLSTAAEEVGGGRDKVGELAVSIENHLYVAWGLCNGPKKPSYYSVLCNLKDPKNPDFRKKVLQGVFSPEKISTLTTKDMASEARKLEIQKILDAKKERENQGAKKDADHEVQKD